MELIVDPEFASLIPPSRDEELAQLEASIRAEGCRDALVVWEGQGILLDGHNRLNICARLGVPYRTVGVDLPDREAAADWIDANQLGRRNLNPDQYSLFRGRRYNRLKKRRRGGGDRRSPAADRKGQNDPNGSPAEVLAKQHGVSESTIKRDGRFAKAVETIKKVDPEIEANVISGNAPPKGIIVEAAKILEVVDEVVEQLDAVPLLGSRRDREAAEVLEKAKDQVGDIMSGTRTVAQVRRSIRRDKKRAEMEAKAEEAAALAPAELTWEVVAGDCIPVLEGLEARPRLVFADPPYNLGIPYGDHYDDARPADEFQRWCEDWMFEVHRVLADDGSFWLLINHEWAWVLAVHATETAGFHLRQWLTWYESFGVNCSGKFNRCSRALLWFTKDRDRFVFNADAVRRPSDRQAKYNDARADPAGKLWDDVWGINPPIPRLVDNATERIPDFPTQLPLALLRPIVGCASDPGDLVLDPFCGSGTTGAACLELGRRFLGIELSGTFADLARKRLLALTPEVAARGQVDRRVEGRRLCDGGP